MIHRLNLWVMNLATNAVRNLIVSIVNIYQPRLWKFWSSQENVFNHGPLRTTPNESLYPVAHDVEFHLFDQRTTK